MPQRDPSRRHLFYETPTSMVSAQWIPRLRMSHGALIQSPDFLRRGAVTR